MRIECTRKDDVTVIAVGGELDVASAPTLQKRVRDFIEDGRIKLIFDFGDLIHITSSGLAVIALCHQLLRPKKGVMAIAGAGGMVKEVIEVWAGRAFQVVPSFPTVEQAIESFAEEN